MASVANWWGAQGTDITLEVTMDPPISISGWSLMFELGVLPFNNATALITKTTAGGGIVIVDALSGIFRVLLSKADTEPLGSKSYYHEIRRTDANNESLISYGSVVIQRVLVSA